MDEIYGGKLWMLFNLLMRRICERHSKMNQLHDRYLGRLADDTLTLHGMHYKVNLIVIT